MLKSLEDLGNFSIFFQNFQNFKHIIENYQWWNQEGGHGGGAFVSQSKALPPLARQSEEKNDQNKLFAANFWIFAPQNRILPPQCLHKKISGAATENYTNDKIKNLHLTLWWARFCWLRFSKIWMIKSNYDKKWLLTAFLNEK